MAVDYGSRLSDQVYELGSLHWSVTYPFNPLNVELNPICHLLILLGDLTFMGTCIVSIFQYIPNKMQRYTVHLCLETALHFSGSISTHHQEASVSVARNSDH
jgi:hypothetical protein